MREEQGGKNQKRMPFSKTMTQSMPISNTKFLGTRAVEWIEWIRLWPFVAKVWDAPLPQLKLVFTDGVLFIKWHWELRCRCVLLCLSRTDYNKIKFQLSVNTSYNDKALASCSKVKISRWWMFFYIPIVTGSLAMQIAIYKKIVFTLPIDLPLKR